MTPRQIIREISERQNSKSFLQELYFQRHPDGSDESTINNHVHEPQTKKEITLSKYRDDVIPNVADQTAFVLYRNSMHSTSCESMEISCGGNRLLHNVEVETPTVFTNSSNKEPHPKHDPTPREVSLTTLFNNISKRNPSLRTHHVHCSTVPILPRLKSGEGGRGLQGVTKPSELSVENGCIVTRDTNMSDIRGKSKKIHAKVIGNRETSLGKNGTEKRLEERMENDVLVSKTQGRSSCVVQDSKDGKRVRLHIYVPTADMNG